VTHGWPGSVIEQLKIVEAAHQSHGNMGARRIGTPFPPGDPVDGPVTGFSRQEPDHEPAGGPNGSRAL